MLLKDKEVDFKYTMKSMFPTEAKIFDESATNSFYGTGLLGYLK